MKELYQELKPQVVVLPDLLLHEADESLHHSLSWNDTIQGWIDPGTEVMFVPQSRPGNKWNWDRVCSHICGSAYEYKIYWIGLPRALATHIGKPWDRILTCHKIMQNYPHMKVHCLGMIAGDIHELGYLNLAGCRSIDSSAPVWRGWNGYSLTKRNDMKMWDQHGTDVDFEANYSSMNDYIIQANLEACNVERISAGATA